jgi:Icc-related predicted phosphoesterase
MPQTIVDLLNKGIEANNADSYRCNNLIRLPAVGELIVTGDLHGHRRNFERIVAFADLANNPDRHVLLQEVIHGGPTDPQGGCLSYKLLFDVVRYKLSFPDRVHIIMGNHDTAFINDSEVMKDGREMNRAMRQAIDQEFPQAKAKIKLAIRQYLFSQPLAVRTDSRIWASHSLPADCLIEKFAPRIFDRPLKISDIARPGSAYLLTWGRRHSQALLDKLAEQLDIDIFILGHQPQEKGFKQAGENLIIIASEHNHGCLIPIDLAKSYTVEQLVESIVPLASLS